MTLNEVKPAMIRITHPLFDSARLEYFGSGARELAEDAGWESVAVVVVHTLILAIFEQFTWRYLRMGSKAR